MSSLVNSERRHKTHTRHEITVSGVSTRAEGSVTRLRVCAVVIYLVGALELFTPVIDDGLVEPTRDALPDSADEDE